MTPTFPCHHYSLFSFSVLFNGTLFAGLLCLFPYGSMQAPWGQIFALCICLCINWCLWTSSEWTTMNFKLINLKLNACRDSDIWTLLVELEQDRRHHLPLYSVGKRCQSDPFPNPKESVTLCDHMELGDVSAWAVMVVTLLRLSENVEAKTLNASEEAKTLNASENQPKACNWLSELFLAGTFCSAVIAY